MARTLAPVLVALWVASTSEPTNAESDEATALSKAVVRVLISVSLADGVITACNAKFPQEARIRNTALQAWRTKQDVQGFEELLQRLSSSQSSIRTTQQDIQGQIRKQAAAIPEKHPEICRDPSQFLASRDLDLTTHIAEVRRLAHLANRKSESAEQRLSADPQWKPTLYTLAQLSAFTTAAMDRVASKPKANESRDLRNEREKAALEVLKGLGVVAVRGRAIDDDDIREWRGDQQSTFALRCRGFIDKNHQVRMKDARGQDVILTGEISSVFEHRHSIGGGLALSRCAVLSPSADTKDLQTATLPEVGGLQLRPPETAEAYAGPNKGIPLGNVEKVVYEASFRYALDGMGNGYTDRNEDIYVLLKNGAAYHHRWKFPFTDINVDLLKHREPDRWFTWEQHSNTLTLTRASGEKAGEQIAIKKPSMLKPLRKGQTFDHRYYFLHIGMAGVRRDLGFDFRSDGTVTVTRSSLVAGNAGYGGGDVVAAGPGFAYSGGGAFGQGFIMAQGPSGEFTARYAIDDYALTLTGPNGETERYFLAKPDSETSAVPDSVVIGGEVFWTRKEKAGQIPARP